ncbi:dna helicase [Fusarium pseudocircinatum]|uniref:Dna helicase n=1 Tax=Fusarium pseudocircinatum TaxID=56676 RepID=A0A8H5PK45_9HYPO|nr:dna helicase [Fusarium pseudocircinatum]
MAQVKLLDQELNDLVLNGIITAEERHQIKTATLDTAQGDEADVVFIDYALVSSIGLQQRAIGQPLRSLTRMFTPSAT